jgi:NAD+ kinase
VRRIGLVVHPSREIGHPLATLHEWAGERGIEVVQLETLGPPMRQVAPFGDLDACDLVTAIGGDGTVLAALRAAADSAAPVLGVACGSLGALSAVTAGELHGALDRFEQGEWSSRKLDAISVSVGGERKGWALNDFVLIRRTGQLLVDVTVGSELYVRVAGDGVIVATPLGSSAYSMASGGPIIAAGTDAFVVTPLLMHGGCAPPIVVRDDTKVILDANPTYAGFDVEVDGRPMEIPNATTFEIAICEHSSTLVAMAEPGLGITALRRRGLVTDSPRVLARDERAARAAADEAAARAEAAAGDLAK